MSLSYDSRFMNNRVPPNKRYQPTEYEHAANCATHAVNARTHTQTHTRTHTQKVIINTHTDEMTLETNPARLHNRQKMPVSFVYLFKIHQCTLFQFNPVCLCLMSHVCD